MIKMLDRVGNSKTCPVAVIVKNGNVLTGLRNYTRDKWKDISVWTCAGGRCEVGETVKQALRREVKEETGIDDLDIHDFIGQTDGVKMGDMILMYYCSTNQDAKLMEPDKFSEWKWVSINEFIRDSVYAGFNPRARKMITDYLQEHFT